MEPPPSEHHPRVSQSLFLQDSPLHIHSLSLCENFMLVVPRLNRSYDLMVSLMVMITEKYGFWLSTIALSSAPILLQILTHFWGKRVNSIVTEPYLDEVFHVRQAQVYCSGNLTQWDPKITTPPGLYLISYLLHHAGFPCDISFLRTTNAYLLCLGIFPLVFLYRNAVSVPKHTAKLTHSNNYSLQNVHTALNVCLFPPLFFFSAIYYTDIASTAFTLLSYGVCVNGVFFRGPVGLARGFAIVVCGAAALFFRQTNIFWVAVFPAGMAVVEHLRRNTETEPKSPSQPSFQDVAVLSWNGKLLYDPPVEDASVQDYLKAVLSIGFSALGHLPSTVTTLTPYGAILFGFVGFVAWNGGVVLGDKSNHVATLHLPQMLYLWPYITFFSLPIQLPYFLNLLPGRLLPTFVLRFRQAQVRNITSTCFVLGGLCVAALGAIHFNTIVHPFTLADNRHYVFYIFRILVLRNPLFKYIAAPVYVTCAWAAVRTLSTGAASAVDEIEGSKTHITTPSLTPTSAKVVVRPEPVPVSFLLIYTLTCILNLVTAPLVEPRYFILPWLTWRLYVPFPIHVRKTGSKAKGDRLNAALAQYDYRLVLETVWFLAINAVTGYMFLYRGFSWPQEPGKVQRFMW